MNWNKAYEFLKGVAAVSGVVAIFSLAYTIYKDAEAREAAARATQELIDQSWQETEILRAIEAAGDSGIRFDDLVKSVQGEWFNSAAQSGVSTSAGKEVEVRRGVIGLISKEVIAVDSDNRYCMKAIPVGILLGDVEYRSQKTYQEALIEKVLSEPNKHSSKDLQEWLRFQTIDGFNPSRIDAHKAVYSLIFSPAPVLVGQNYLGGPPNDKLRVLE